MNICSIEEKKNKKTIYITYSIAQGDCLLEIELISKQINFTLFYISYFYLKAPFNHFKLKNQDNGFISIPSFLEILKKVQKNHIKGTSSELINQLIDCYDQIEADLNSRLINLENFPNNPQFFDENSLNQSDALLLSKLQQIDSRISDIFQNRNPQWQLFYIMETTATQIQNGEEKKIMILGRTDTSIQNQIIQFKKDYQEKFEFKPLFTQKLFSPEKTIVNKKYFHKKLLSFIPNSKVYLQVNENESSTIHYEFYYLTKEFVYHFEKLLFKFIDKHKSEYQIDKLNNEDSNQEMNEQNDEEIEETLNIQQTEIIEKEQQEQVQNQIIQNQITQSENDNDQITHQDEQLNNLTDCEELSSSLDDEFSDYTFFDRLEPNQKYFGVPQNYELFDQNKQIVQEASKLIKDKENRLRALLFLAAAKKQMEKEKQFYLNII